MPETTPRPEVVLFDAAGTLFELRRPVGETYSAAAAQHGVDLPAWRLDDAFARVMRRATPMVFADAAPREIAELERSWWRDVVRQVLMATDSTTRFPEQRNGSPGFDAFFADLWSEYAGDAAWALREGCVETLTELRASDLRLGVVSNFDHRLDSLLEVLGIADFFEIVLRPGLVGSAKPEARLFEATLSQLGAAAASARYIGDDPEVDGTAARACGIHFIDVAELVSLRELPARIEAS